MLKYFRSPSQLYAAASSSDLYVARNGSPGELVTAALNAFGGINSVVKRGSKVVIKVNMSFNRRSEQAATTNPELVEMLVRLCRDAGASQVLVLDHTLDNGKMCMEKTGIKEAVERAGGKIKVIDSHGDYKETKISRGKNLTYADISKDVLDADVFINVPIAKVHNSATATLSMKNLMGIVWNRRELHLRGLHQCIADLSTEIKPDLIILDAYRILMTHGPGGPGEVKEAGEVIVGTDPVAVDVYGSLLLEKVPQQIGYIEKASELGLGQMNIDKINVVYVDAQETGTEPEETKAPETSPPETTPPETSPERSGTPPPATPGETIEEEAGIPAFILVPAAIVAFLIGLRMRRKKEIH
jgi:uncharacterized protein (DUF362 family)